MDLLSLLIPPLIAGFAAYGIAHYLTGASINLARRGGILAHPNHRTSHTQPTPRLGGIGYTAGIILPLIIFLPLYPAIQRMQGVIETDPVRVIAWAGLLTTIILAFILGLWDDRGNPPAIVKLLGQIVIAAIPAVTGLAVHQLQLPYIGWISLPVWAGAIITFCFVMLMMNTVNFMDGINGLAGRFGSILGVIIFLWAANRPWFGEVTVLGAIMIGAASGFLRWNYPAAKTFMGDCGSQPMGALVACALLLAVTNERGFSYDNVFPINVDPASFDPPRFFVFDPFIACLIAVSPFVFDVLFTLTRRILRGENPLKAHREHLYQRHLIANGEDHIRTTEFVWWFLAGAGALTIIYVRYTDLFDDLLRSILIIATGGLLITYYMMVRQAERNAPAMAGLPTLSSQAESEPPPGPLPRVSKDERTKLREAAAALWERFYYELMVKLREANMTYERIVVLPDPDSINRHDHGSESYLRIREDSASELEKTKKLVIEKWSANCPDGLSLRAGIVGLDQNKNAYIWLAHTNKTDGQQDIEIDVTPNASEPLPVMPEPGA